jgi:ABC-type multidrug transport system fused ATPase/permease subunit
VSPQALSLPGRDLVFRRGEVAAVVGPVGSGKSVLVAELLAHGRVGGVALGDATTVGSKAETPQLLSGTLHDNIALGRDVDVTEAASAADLGGVRGELSLGLDTEVGSRGARLSGGQRQRAALARALAGEPGVLVIDNLSGLDRDTEERVWRSVRARAAGAIVIITGNSRAVIDRADRLLVMDGGLVVDDGPAAEVAARNVFLRSLL